MSDRLLVSTRKGLFTVRRGAAGWSVDAVALAGDNVTLSFAPDADTLLAALDHGHFGVKIHRSTDAGRTFEEIGTPTFPPKPEDWEDPEGADQDGRGPVPWSLKQVWALESGGGSVLWCGTIPGGLFRSGDGGASWDLVDTLWFHEKRKGWFGGGADWPGIHSVCVDPRDARAVTLGISCGGVWQTKDGGETWSLRAKGMRAEYMPPDMAHDQNIQDPHRVVQCPSAPDVFWAQHHNGIFRSTDDCANWTEIRDVQPSVFGFCVAVHPTDPETAWFAPAIKDDKRYPVGGKVVVTRTRDGGRSFDLLTEGLPQEHAYDIVYRHALDIDKTGERLAFGSTTGALWVTEDQGDHWTRVSAHLPPIYAVRFGG